VKIPFKDIFKNFFEEIGNGKIEVYNEFSLQHELGIYLRKELLKYGKFKVQFEKNSLEILKYEESYSQEKLKKRFGNKKIRKKEIDIVIFQEETEGVKNLITSIELKYPRNGQVPESMYSFIKDIRFLEGLTKRGYHNENYFKEGYFICLVDDPLFYEVKHKKEGIYKYFRNDNYQVKIPKTTRKPTGKNKTSSDLKIELDKEYNREWEPIENERKYLIIEV
tara:strand:- start:351 stop:1016 length:666 start_codon:yes stop_codon:yes gene_type:complete